ncbi:hypothetical protein J2X04_000955 [Lysobacter niabensis]|uniref:Band 7 domain-containing protein n=1 Tax=Agrilutibacter niabensis TaxID=380628 RepID=A0ABU1VNB3_9GAMM|nr:hypothetical protein [Lysobacter niabensis]MDR7098608.1 hypothetical protein [Lysobacter niabensis]
METFFWVIAAFALIAAVSWARDSLLGYFARPLQNVSHTVRFPFSVTLTVPRQEVPALVHAGVYDAIAVQRNPYALEMRLTNTTDPRTIDPFSFYLPLDQTVLRDMASLLAAEADRLDETGSPHLRQSAT